MSATSSKVSVSRLVHICAEKGIQNVVISPGSRNAPLTISFAENPHFNCVNIPDERVAGFFALGMAQSLNKPVILCCTSGSALLNYAPAIAEAFHQKIPLLVVSADRPVEWIDQRAGQTMRQKDVYQNYIKKSFELIEEAQQAQHIWFNDRIINEAINLCTAGGCGPVHINVPMREPLYEIVESSSQTLPKIIIQTETVSSLSSGAIHELDLEWAAQRKVLIIVGQGNPSDELNKNIERIAELSKVVVLTETTSNVKANHVLPSIDRLIDGLNDQDFPGFAPDLIISFGAAIVSKKIRFMLRKMQVAAHWHIDSSDGYVDTYQALTRLIPVDPNYFLGLLLQFPVDHQPSSFKSRWKERDVLTRQRHSLFLAQCPWSDLLIMQYILNQIPSGTLHLASSTPVRYSQLFDPRTDLEYRCNRGVSGIDGCSSTATGYAYMCEHPVTLITGDIAFFYDSNAYWHHHIGANLRIILINNGGGNIFRYVKGPDTTNHLEKHFEAAHNTSAKGICESYGLLYGTASNMEELEEGLFWLFNTVKDRAALLEINTPREENIPVLKNYFKSLNPGL